MTRRQNNAVFTMRQDQKAGDPWGMEKHLSPADAGYLYLVSALYRDALDEVRKRHTLKCGAGLFLKRDPYGILSDEMKKAIMGEFGDESKKTV